MATQSRVPTGDISYSGSWDKTTNMWSYVDETAAGNDGDTTYIQETAGGSATYWASFSAFTVPAGATITSVAFTIVARKLTDTDTRSISTRIRVGSTQYQGTIHIETTSYQSFTHTWTTNPATSAAWTVADVNGTGANPLNGMGCSHNATADLSRITAYELVVTYSPAPSAYISATDSATADTSVLNVQANRTLSFTRTEQGRNLLSVSGATVSPDATGWTAASGGTTTSRDTTEHWQGDASFKVVTDGTITAQGGLTLIGAYPTYTVSPAGTYIGSIYAKGSGNVYVYIRTTYTDGTLDASTNVNITLTSTWTRYTTNPVTSNPAKKISQVSLGVRNTGLAANTFWLDGAQIEFGSAATGWEYPGQDTAALSTYINRSVYVLVAEVGADAALLTLQHLAQAYFAALETGVDIALLQAYINRSASFNIIEVGEDAASLSIAVWVQAYINAVETNDTASMQMLERIVYGTSKKYGKSWKYFQRDGTNTTEFGSYTKVTPDSIYQSTVGENPSGVTPSSETPYTPTYTKD